MKKTFLTIMLAAGIGSACAATAAAWEFSSGTPSEQFMTGSGINLEGWSISSPVNSAASYTDWATVTGGDRNISTQTVGMWLDLSSLGSAATIYSFGETGSLRGLQLVSTGTARLLPGEREKRARPSPLGRTSLTEDGSTSPCPSVRIPPPGKRISRFS